MKHVAFSGVAVAVATTIAMVGACNNTQGATFATAQASACPSNVAWIYPPALPPLNSELWQYSQANLGRKVGDGQCAELPDTALRLYGAMTFFELGPTSGNDVDYVWGDLVSVVTPQSPRLVNVLPGDVIQFANADFKWQEANRAWYTAVDAHHTAVVQAVSADGANVCVFQENANGNLFVTYGFFEIVGMTQGTLHVYRPKPHAAAPPPPRPY